MSDNSPDLKGWMDERGLKAKDVAAMLHVEEQTIRIWRSQGVPPRRAPHVVAMMAGWGVAQEPEAMAVEVAEFAAAHQNLVLHPTEEQFDLWTAAFKRSPYSTLKEWALEGLNAMATKTIGQSSKYPAAKPMTLKVAEEPEETKPPAKKAR